MGTFLSVGKGSSEPSIFLEMKYSGAKESDSSPLIFVGKGKFSEHVHKERNLGNRVQSDLIPLDCSQHLYSQCKKTRKQNERRA